MVYGPNVCKTFRIASDSTDLDPYAGGPDQPVQIWRIIFPDEEMTVEEFIGTSGNDSVSPRIDPKRADRRLSIEMQISFLSDCVERITVVPADHISLQVNDLSLRYVGKTGFQPFGAGGSLQKTNPHTFGCTVCGWGVSYDLGFDPIAHRSQCHL